jgi:hypothetical protein
VYEVVESFSYFPAEPCQVTLAGFAPITVEGFCNMIVVEKLLGLPGNGSDRRRTLRIAVVDLAGDSLVIFASPKDGPEYADFHPVRYAFLRARRTLFRLSD